MVASSKFRELAAEFPFASAFQNQILKDDFLNQDQKFEESLKRAALLSTDRSHLFNLIFEGIVQDKVNEVDAELSKDMQASLESEKQDLQAQLEQHIQAQVAEISFPSDLLQQQKEEETPTIKKEAPNEKPQAPSKRSFTDWIRSMEEPQRRSSILQEDLVRKFIDNEPSLKRERQEFFKPEEMGKLSIMEDEEFVTETLAGLYANQGHFEKAMRAYEILAVNKPEKSDYFASLISELKKK